MENTGASKIVLILGGISRDQLIVRRLRKFVQSKERLKKSFCEVDLIFMPSRTLSAFLPFSYKWYSGMGFPEKDYAFCSLEIHSWQNLISPKNMLILL